jgi:hypothetical protein
LFYIDMPKTCDEGVLRRSRCKKQGGKNQMEISKDYNPQDVEPKWQRRWENLKIYCFKRDDLKTPTYVIDTPPPYSSGEGGTERGVSHGHGAQLDILRHRRALQADARLQRAVSPGILVKVL